MLLLLGGLVMLFPMVWMLLSAFKTEQEMFDYPPQLLPKRFTLEVLQYMWGQRNFSRMFVNSTIVAAVVTTLTVATSAYIGFVFAKFRFRFREGLFYFVIATMMIPLPVLLIPHFQIVSWLGWVNTYQGLIAPFALSAFGIFLMRGFMIDFPDELIEAARIDGASALRTFVMIVLPTMAPACAALGIITFLHQWESLLWPIVVANQSDMQTLSVGLASLTSQTAENSSLMNPFAGAFIAAAPLVIMFLLFQRHIIQGIAITGLK
ncbi:MAG: carbohydrate ABC transporter permease [Devosia sp.]|nr:carbohydrate ABC transporter permease [Devosia sp.]